MWCAGIELAGRLAQQALPGPRLASPLGGGVLL
jgi:hypothetical protein